MIKYTYVVVRICKSTFRSTHGMVHLSYMVFDSLDIMKKASHAYNKSHHFCGDKGPVVQSIVSLTTSLRRQFVKYMLTI